MAETREKNRARHQAKLQLEGIVTMVKRLEHVQECDGADCELSDRQILEGLNIFYKEGMTASEEDRQNYHDEDDARENISDDPLSVEVRSDWHIPGDNDVSQEYVILLCTGGPAVRITGYLDGGSPRNANLEYQDWFTPWEKCIPITDEEEHALLVYAEQFYFGE